MDFNAINSAISSSKGTVTFNDIKSCEPHKHSDKLMLVTLNNGSKYALSKAKFAESKLGENMTFITEGEWIRPTDVKLNSMELTY